MNVLVQIVFCILVVFLKESIQKKNHSKRDCEDFRSQCTSFCLTRIGGVNTNQCWGSPAYRYCTCSDSFIYLVPGYTCDHPECPKDNVQDGTTKRPIQRKQKPIRRIPQRASNQTETETTKPETKDLFELNKPIITDGCMDFRSQCNTVCGGEIENDQCWGFPKYRQCKCTNGFIHLIPGYDCEHSDCIDCKIDFGYGSCKQPKLELDLTDLSIKFEELDN